MSTQPEYVSFEPSAREEMLSQIGSFSPSERALFHKLCESWTPVIDRNRFIARTGTSERDISALDRVMKLLRGAQLGLVTTTVADKTRVPTGLVLTGKADLRFFMHVIEEETSRLSESGYRVLPSAARLAELKALPPDYHIADANPEALVEAFSADEHEDAIFRVRLLGEFEILTTSRAVKALIGNVIDWLRTTLEERSILEEIARARETSIMDIKNQISEAAPKVWLDLTRIIVEQRSEIAYKKGLDEGDEIFQAAFLMMTFTEARMGAARAKKEDETKIQQALGELASAVAGAPNGTMASEEFDGLALEAEERLEHAEGMFRGRIASVLLTPQPRRKLPVLSSLAGHYVHRDKVRNVFEGARLEVSRQLRQEYVDLMEAYLRGRLPEAGEIFSSRSDLDHDVRNRIDRLNRLLGDLMSRPQLLAEAVIRDAKLKKEGITTDELKLRLAPYFNVKQSELLPSSELLDVDLLAIFDEAFARVNVIRQILLRISGRHDSLRRSYLRRFGSGSQRISYADDGDARAPGGGRTRTERADAPGVRTRGMGNRDYRPETSKPPRRPRTPPLPEQPKVKSPREVERAWQDFGEALHIKAAESDEFS